MSAPFSPEELRALQAAWDAEARAHHATRPATGAPSLFAAWAHLWRTAPAGDRRDVLRLALLTPALILIFAGLWRMLPA